MIASDRQTTLSSTWLDCNANLLTVWCMVQCTNHQWLFGTLAGTEHQAPVVQQQVVEGAIEDHPHQRNDLPPPEQPNFTPIFVTPQQLLLTDTLLSNYQTICYYQCVLVLWHSGTIQLSNYQSGTVAHRQWVASSVSCLMPESALLPPRQLLLWLRSGWRSFRAEDKSLLLGRPGPQMNAPARWSSGKKCPERQIVKWQPVDDKWHALYVSLWHSWRRRSWKQFGFWEDEELDLSLSLGLSQFLSAICGSSLTSVGSSRTLLITSVMMLEHVYMLRVNRIVHI